MKNTSENPPEGSEMSSLRLPVSLKRTLQELAQINRRSFSNYIQIVLEKHASDVAKNGAAYAMPEAKEEAAA